MPWFPDWHRGTPEDVAAFDEAHRDLNDYSDRLWLANGRRAVPETERYHELNDRANETAAKLSPWQRSPLAQDLRELRAGLAERRKRRVQRRGRGEHGTCPFCRKGTGFRTEPSGRVSCISCGSAAGWLRTAEPKDAPLNVGVIYLKAPIGGDDS